MYANNPAAKIKDLGNGRYQIRIKKGDSVLLSNKEVKTPIFNEPNLNPGNEFHWGLH